MTMPSKRTAMFRKTTKSSEIKRHLSIQAVAELVSAFTMEAKQIFQNNFKMRRFCVKIILRLLIGGG